MVCTKTKALLVAGISVAVLALGIYSLGKVVANSQIYDV